MKYELNHTLQSNQPTDGNVNNVKSVTFKPGEVKTAAELTDAGFDLEHLKANGAVEELKGTETDEDRAARRQLNAIPTTTQDATPHMATAPKGDPETNLDAGARKGHAGAKASADDEAAKGPAKK